MTLDTLISNLQTIRTLAGHGNLQVLFRDPVDGFLMDELGPCLAEVESEELHVFEAFDLELNDFYVEI
jgi:hypothetical protein